MQMATIPVGDEMIVLYVRIEDRECDPVDVHKNQGHGAPGGGGSAGQSPMQPPVQAHDGPFDVQFDAAFDVVAAVLNRAIVAAGITAAGSESKSGIIVLLPEGDTEVTYPDGDTYPLHMTLAYLGDLDTLSQGDRDAVQASCAYLAGLFEPFELEALSPAEFGDVDVTLYQDIAVKTIRDTVEDHAVLGHILRRGETHPGFLPHITGGPDKVKIDRIGVWLGAHRVEYPFKTPDKGLQTPEPETDSQE